MTNVGLIRASLIVFVPPRAAAGSKMCHSLSASRGGVVCAHVRCNCRRLREKRNGGGRVAPATPPNTQLHDAQQKSAKERQSGKPWTRSTPHPPTETMEENSPSAEIVGHTDSQPTQQTIQDDLTKMEVVLYNRKLSCYRVIHYSYAVRYNRKERFMKQMRHVNDLIRSAGG